jgi:quinol monooxygenase YgiN
MHKLALLASLEARSGMEAAVEDFLKSAQPLALQEAGTRSWYAYRIGPSTFGIFDTFSDETGRQAHVTGQIAMALYAKAEDLFAKPPKIEMLDVLASKA